MPHSCTFALLADAPPVCMAGTSTPYGKRRHRPGIPGLVWPDPGECPKTRCYLFPGSYIVHNFLPKLENLPITGRDIELVVQMLLVGVRRR